MVEITNIEKLKEALNNSQNILIVFGEDYSLDELAAGLSLGMSLEKSGNKITFFSQRPPLVEEASLFGIAKITNKLNSGNLIISIPNALNSVDKVTHYLDGETLNIVVHPVGNGAQLAQEKITMTKLENLPGLTILINTTLAKFSGKLNTQEQKMYSEIPKIIIGKTLDASSGEVLVAPVGAASLSETAFWLLTKLDLPIDGDCASNLFQGMKFATKFSPPLATASTFEAASICLKAKPVLPQVTTEESNISQTVGTPQSWQPQDLGGAISSQKPVAPKFSQAGQKIDEPESDEEFSSANQKGGKIQSDWLMPKIFRSGSKTSKT